MKSYLIRNMSLGARDYPLKNGTSIYLGTKRDSTDTAVIKEDEISDAIKAAVKKGLLTMEEVSE